MDALSSAHISRPHLHKRSSRSRKLAFGAEVSCVDKHEILLEELNQRIVSKIDVSPDGMSILLYDIPLRITSRPVGASPV